MFGSSFPVKEYKTEMVKIVKKYIKIIGNIVTVIAVIFVVKKLVSIDIDYAQLLKKKNIVPMIIVTIGLALVALFNFMPWKKLVEMFSGKELEAKDCVMVYSKSNLLKYVPGNVFQYVGRNALAVEKNIPHMEVAAATLFDVGLTVLAASLISLFFLSDVILDFLHENPTIWHIAVVLIVLFILLVLIVAWVWQEKFKKILLRYQHLVTWQSIKVLLWGLIYYILVMFLSSAFYLVILHYVLDVSVRSEVYVQLFSAYTLAWLVGFVTPGAPAGIGIKEAVMMSVTGNLLGLDVITLSMVILRILSIFADVLAFMMAFVYNKGTAKSRRKE